MKKRAYAKINLVLKVISKRNDGYHDLEMIMQKVSLYDEMEFVKSDKIEVICDKVKMEENLVYKVALYLKTKYNVEEGIKIIINKKIPIEAGLGGGSSDASCTINALNKIWKLKMSIKEREKTASLFGSDTIFFIDNSCAYVTGRGESVEKIDNNLKGNILIVKPDFGYKTKEVFSLVREYSQKTGLIKMKESIKEGNYKDFLELIENDLEKALKNDEKYQKIKKIKDFLVESGADKAMMSGSGSAIFALFNNSKEFKRVYSMMKKDGFEVYKCKM